MKMTREKARNTSALPAELMATQRCERGLQGVALSAILHSARRTHGGFYRHSAAKDDLGSVRHALRLRQRRIAQHPDLRLLLKEDVKTGPTSMGDTNSFPSGRLSGAIDSTVQFIDLGEHQPQRWTVGPQTDHCA